VAGGRWQAVGIEAVRTILVAVKKGKYNEAKVRKGRS
jgi:hypothetical protein